MSNSRETGQEKYTFPDRIQKWGQDGYTEEKIERHFCLIGVDYIMLECGKYKYALYAE